MSALHAALDELYRAPPEEFILTRARLERELRDAGHTDEAAAIKRLRRPSLGVWAVNRLARDAPDAIDELIRATDNVRATQHETLQGGSADAMREAARDRQSLIDELVEQATGALIGHAPNPRTYRDDIANLLEAASVDADTADLLRAGRLTRSLSAPAGFDALGEPPGAAVNRPSTTRTSGVHKPRREIERAQRDVEDAQRRAAAAAAAAEDADAEATSAGIGADTVTARVAEVERALEQARTEQRSAAKRAEEARARAAATQTQANEAAERVRRAEERLRRLGHGS